MTKSTRDIDDTFVVVPLKLYFLQGLDLWLEDVILAALTEAIVSHREQLILISPYQTEFQPTSCLSDLLALDNCLWIFYFVSDILLCFEG